MLTDWKNGKTYKEHGHDLLIDTDEKIFGLYQARHYFFLKIPVYAGGINRKTVNNEFKYQLWNGDVLWFEQHYSFDMQVVWFADLLFGAPAVALATYQVIKERFRTTIINGEACAEVEVVNTPTHAANILDFDGHPLSEDEIAALVNPSWEHTFFRTRTSEFANPILDSDASLGVETVIIDGRIEMPIYRLNLGPETEVDIVMDTLSGAGRADRYQFRWGGAGETEENVDAFTDMFDAVAFTALYKIEDEQNRSVGFSYMLPPYVDMQRRGIIQHAKFPSICETREGHFYMLVQHTKSGEKGLDEYMSRDSGHSWKLTKRIINGETQMAQERVIDSNTGERGVVLFEGVSLRFRRSRDNFESFITVAEFDKAQPVGLSVTKSGVLYVGDGKGVLFVSYDTGSTWSNHSTTPIKKSPT